MALASECGELQEILQWLSEGVNQVGCIYTAQGFEFDYVGVIFGNDLVYRSSLGWQGNKEISFEVEQRMCQ